MVLQSKKPITPHKLNVRHKFFLSLSGIILTVFVGNDLFNIIDECLTAYALSVLLCTVTLVLFGYWWHWNREASEVYKWVMVLIAGIGVTDAGNFHIRLYRVFGDCEGFDRMIASAPWIYRTLPKVLALAYLIAFIISRMVYGEEEEDEK